MGLKTVSVIQKVIKRTELPAFLEAAIKGGRVLIDDRVILIGGGYNKGSWEHIKQSDKILVKAWKVKEQKNE